MAPYTDIHCHLLPDVDDGGVVGVAADDGRLLWETPSWKISIAMVPSPVPVPGDRLFLCGGYNAGSLMLRLENASEGIQPIEEFRLKASAFGATQHTPILYQDPRGYRAV